VDYLLLEGGKARGIHDFPVNEGSEWFRVFEALWTQLHWKERA
jgi:hypothetical protein